MKIYTDGGCDRNGQADAVGAWAWVADNGEERSGVELGTTSNRMELRAVIEAVVYAARHRAPDELVTIYTDSQMTMLCALGRWKRKANRDLWAEYDKARAGMKVAFQWVRGHSGVPGNERADELCRLAMSEADAVDPDVLHLRSILAGG